MSEAKFDPRKFLQYKIKPTKELLNVLKPARVQADVRPRKRRPLMLDILFAFIIALFIVASIRMFFVQVVTVSSDSMEPALSYRDAVIVNKIAYGIGSPFWRISQTRRMLWVLPNPLYGRLARLSRGRYLIRLARDPKRMEVIVLKSPAKGQEGRDMIKRIIGMPGEEVSMKKGIVFINGRKLNEKRGIIRDSSEMARIRIPYGSYFVLGDNRPTSLDSRSFGPVSGNDMLGKAFMRIWPPGRDRAVR